MSESKQFTRATSDKIIAGVCGGIAAYTGVDVSLVRIITVVLALASAGTLIPVLYLVAWATVPEAGAAKSPAQDFVDRVNEPDPDHTRPAEPSEFNGPNQSTQQSWEQPMRTDHVGETTAAGAEQPGSGTDPDAATNDHDPRI